MKLEHKAIIQRAQRDGLLPMQYAAELVDYDMVQLMWGQMLKYEVGPKKLSEAQQDAVLAELQEGAKKISTNVVETIASAGTKTVRMQLKDLKISNGQLVGVVSGEDPNFNELISKVQDKSGVLLVLYELDYHQAMDGIQSEKDQKPLDLDSPEPPAKAPKAPRVSSPTSAGAIAKKAIELTPKQIEDGREFIIKQQNCSPDALQNLLKINRQRAEALLKHFEGEGIIQFVGTEASGQYELVRTGDAPAPKDEDRPVLDEATLEVFYATAVKAVLKAGSADDSVLTAIYGDDDNAIEQALVRMEDDGIVSKPSPEGLRAVLTLP